MDFICPLCNGLNTVSIVCENCNIKMIDGGREADYYDDYSTYLPMSLTARIDGYSLNKCVHLFYCPSCGKDDRIPIEKQKM